MKEGTPAKGGAIVNISSTTALVTYPDILPYSASKAAVIQMSKSAAVDLARHNIRWADVDGMDQLQHCPKCILLASIASCILLSVKLQA